jgi:hypothetical protein
MEPARARAEEQSSGGPRAGRLQDALKSNLAGAQLLFELQINAATSRVDSNSLLRGGNADYHTGLI